jgi:hypothetical protein
MQLAVFCRWRAADVRSKVGLNLAAAAAEHIFAEETDRHGLLAVYFSRVPPEAGGMLTTAPAAETFVGVEIGDTGEAKPGDYLFLVTFDVPREGQGEFDSWYETEHVARLMEVPGWLRCRRYAVAGDGDAPTRVALHELASLEALDSPLRAAAAASEWRQKLAKQPWFASGKFDTFKRVRVPTQPTSSPAAR